MSIFALADLHLALGLPEKKMDVFGEPWVNYTDKIETAWKQVIHNEDLVLVAGDISWGSTPEEAKIDLDWIDSLPGTKVLIKGNHDYWWSSLSKAQKVLPPSLHLIQNNAFQWNNVAIAGTRLWDTSEYNFDHCIHYMPNPKANINTHIPTLEESERIFTRELTRLEASLKCMNQNADIKIAMTHYPPISTSLEPSKASQILEKYHVQYCVFGHLHNVIKGTQFGNRNGIEYLLTAADFLNFTPIKIL